MRGQIAITKLEVDMNSLNMTKFQLFREALKAQIKGRIPETIQSTVGWYAYILRDGIYYFKWCSHSENLSEKYLQTLAKDGYTVACFKNSRHYPICLNDE